MTNCKRAKYYSIKGQSSNSHFEQNNCAIITKSREQDTQKKWEKKRIKISTLPIVQQ